MGLTTLSAIAGGYGLFFVDQFGVLHDGIAPYPGAVVALAQLRADGRRVVILSNSGKRSAVNEARLTRLGFPRGSYDLFLSSGEVGWRLLAEGGLPRPRRVFLISRYGDRSPIEGLGIEVTAESRDADLIIIAGSEAPRRSREDYRAALAGAAEAGVPALCVNPDMTMLTESGHAFGSGVIARDYEALGGRVTWVGKPWPTIYEAAWALIGDRPPTLGVGDSVEHDVAGAKGAGADAALVLTGIHAGEGEAGLEALYAAHGARPDHVLPRFAW